MARHRRFPDRPDRALYEAALRDFEAGGHRADARFARYRLSMIDNGASIETLPELQTMLAEAKRNGARDIEFMLSMDMAGKSLEKNRFADHRRYLEQARSVAVLSGDARALHAAEYALLIDDGRRGDIEALERRIVGLQSSTGSNDLTIGLAATIAIQRLEDGRTVAARIALQRATAAVTEHGRLPAPPLMVGFFDYVRAHIAMQEGRVAEAEAAIAAFRRSMPEDVQSTIAYSEASLALIRGDRAAARRAIDAGLASLAGIQDAPTVSEGRLGAAFLLTRAGDPAQAERLYRQVLPSARAAGYGQWEAFAELGLAEVAASRGDWSTARQHMQQAARLPQTRIWVYSARLGLLELGNAIASGDRAAASARAEALQVAAIRTGDHFTLSALHGLAAAAPADFGLRPPVLTLPPYRGEAAWLVDAVRTVDRRAIASR
jgi:tetratricopeptide (TPR) repeat protein